MAWGYLHAIFVLLEKYLYICSSMINKEDKVKMFVNELNDITDSKLRELAKIMIENADDYFFVVPASSSGKYHPSFDLGDGGLVRHTRCVAYYAQCMAESMMFDEHDKNLIILAALAHDIKKQGDGKGKHTVTEHPILASAYLSQLASEHIGLISSEDLVKVCTAVECHMGKWGMKDGLPGPKSEFDKALQAADYIASRKDILSFNFRPTEEVKIDVDEVNGDPGDFIIDFGKYKGQGKTIREIHESELATISNGPSTKKGTYIEWMVGLEDFQMKDAQDAARKFLEKYKTEPPKKLQTVSVNRGDDLPF